MVAFLRPSLIRTLPAWCAAVGGAIVAAIFLLISTDSLESLVWTTGVAAVVPAAAPPRGTTARLLLALGGGLFAAALLWSSLFLLVGPGGLLVRRPRRADGVPAVRRADAHPDAPPRKPMTAADLGTPMMEVGLGVARDERTIPVDLDLPLAAFDPTAILPAPMAPVRPVASLHHATFVAPPVKPVGAPAGTSPDPMAALPTADEPEPTVIVAHDQAVEPDAIEEPTAPTVRDVPVLASAVAGVVTESPDKTEISGASGPPTIEALLRRLEKGAGRRRRSGAH